MIVFYSHYAFNELKKLIEKHQKCYKNVDSGNNNGEIKYPFKSHVM